MNGLTRGLWRMYYQAWYHQYDPQYFSTDSNLQDNSKI